MVHEGLKYFEELHHKRMILKPNLINDEPPPTTTSYGGDASLVKYYWNFQVTIAEGSGWCDTFQAYKSLGCYEMAEKYGIRLVDLDRDECIVGKAVWRARGKPQYLGFRAESCLSKGGAGGI